MTFLTPSLRSMATAMLVLALSTARLAVAQGSRGERIDGFVRDEMQRQHVPGVAIGVVKNGTVATLQGYGSANLEHHVPVGPDTIFQSGSVGKQFTSLPWR